MLKVIKYPSKTVLTALLKRPSDNNIKVETAVKQIIKNVCAKGDVALKEYALRFDQVKLKQLKLTKKEINDAALSCPPELKAAITTAYTNIFNFHLLQVQRPLGLETMSGVFCERKSVPIENVGLYIPGGTAPLFSTVLMLGIPAQIATCSNVILCTPSGEKINPAVAYAAKACGIKTIYRVGGAQAIAAMAFGTKSIPRVDKIFGPGNQYVTTAKRLLSMNTVAIDMPAGPSEVCVIADTTADARFVAADLLSQAEHGRDSQVMLISNSVKMIDDCNKAIRDMMKDLPRAAIAAAALKNSKAFLVKNMNEAMHIANVYAPEHLIIATLNAKKMSDKVINAGSVFIGNYSPESVGDYASGTNHTLPTSGYARAFSGVSVDSFVKKITFQELTKAGLKKIAPTIINMARAEGLDAHALAVEVRL